MQLTQSYWPAETGEPLLKSTVASALLDAVARTPEGVALVAGMPDPADRKRWTYAELLSLSERVARALLSLFEPGERVAVWAPNLPEWLFLEYGAALAGVVVVTVNPSYQPHELEYVLRQSRAVGLFYVEEYRGNPMAASAAAVLPKLPAVREAIAFSTWQSFLDRGDENTTLPVVTPDDLMQIQYTSGTTGFPKGAMLNHGGVTNNARLVSQRWAMEQGSVYLSALPMFHTSGSVVGALAALQSNATFVLVYQFDPSLTLELMESEGANIFVGVPTMLIALMEHPEFSSRNLSSLKAVSSGGATVPVDLVRRIEGALQVQFTIVFGQTESSPIITQTRLDDSPIDKGETVGQPLPHTEVKIIDPETGNIQPIGQMGELCTRGYLVMQGYFDMPEATTQTIDAEGWLHTGDLCSMDARGYCVVEGRLKDMIIRGGENIYPREMEECLFNHPAVAEVAVVGVPDAKWGEQVAAFIRFGSDQHLTEDELLKYVRTYLSPQKSPTFWIQLDDFPLTGSGKIQKFVLRDRWVAGRYEDNKPR